MKLAYGWRPGGGSPETVVYCSGDPDHYTRPETDWSALADILAEKVRSAADAWTGCDWETASEPWQISADGIDPDAMRQAADWLADNWEGLFDEDIPDEIRGEVDTIWNTASAIRDDRLSEEHRHGNDADDGLTAQDIEAACSASNEAAEYQDACISAAKSAAEAGEEAVGSLRDGKLLEAMELLKHASSIEGEYGDDPEWCGPRYWLEAVIEAMDGGESQIREVDGCDNIIVQRVLRDGVLISEDGIWHGDGAGQVRIGGKWHPARIGNWSWDPTGWSPREQLADHC